MNYFQSVIFKMREEHYLQPYQINKVVQAKNFIDKHAATNITLKDIACNACLSKFHFIRLFKKCYGRTPHQYLTEIKMLKAKQLLKSGITVADTCFFLGFSSTTSFIGLFKKMTGQTPSLFSKKSNFEELVFYIYSELYGNKK